MRELHPGMGQAVAERTVLRTVSGTLETWEDVAVRVAAGNVSLAPGGILGNMGEFEGLCGHICDGRILMSGRHLQHGDLGQKYRNMEVFTNCATAATSALSYLLLLNGSGVGRCYDDDMMVVDWDKAPQLSLFLPRKHKDSKKWRKVQGWFGKRAARCFRNRLQTQVHHKVHDSREGWAKALELYETMAYRGESDKMLTLDFSGIRPSGQAIEGMQGRPSCGPVPTMEAFKNIRDNVVGKRLSKWKQAMYVDHYTAESVLVGGARRAARIAVKHWEDADILDFISIKKDGGLWSANNSVGVDQKFWYEVDLTMGITGPRTNGYEVFDAVTSAAYHDGTGEPGLLNLHRLNNNEEGLDWDELRKGKYVGSKKYQVEEGTEVMLGELASIVENKKFKFIVNPCGEIPLLVLGGFCVIADVVPYHCEDQEEFEDALRYAVRSLIRVNTMDSVYSGEVLRTNRIGVGCTGLHEWLWDKFKLSFQDCLSPSEFSVQVRLSLSLARRACEEESDEYAVRLGLNPPHTVTTIKPAGTTSKLFGLTEGCHLPALGHYLRWVQFRNDDPLVQNYASRGYPVRELTTYRGTTIVGFPTEPEIAKLGMGDKITYAGDASMDEQFVWLKLLEQHWLGTSRGNQLSYTMKYKPEETSYEEFREKMLRVSEVKCVSVMPQIDGTAYEYQPEEPLTKEQYDECMSKIDVTTEDIGKEHVDCGSGGCPIYFNEGDK